jgi:hypothetical protein
VKISCTEFYHNRDNKCGKYGSKLIYARNESVALTTPIFMKITICSAALCGGVLYWFSPKSVKKCGKYFYEYIYALKYDCHYADFHQNPNLLRRVVWRCFVLVFTQVSQEMWEVLVRIHLRSEVRLSLLRFSRNVDLIDNFYAEFHKSPTKLFSVWYQATGRQTRFPPIHYSLHREVRTERMTNKLSSS